MMEKNNSGNGGGGGQPKFAKKKKAADPCTLFVKFHPPSAFITRQHLSDHFSNYGPVNRCSVIRQKGKPKSQQKQEAGNDNEQGGGEEEVNYDRGSKGYGFIRFVNEEDAKDAADAIRKKSQQKGRNGGGEVMVVEGVQYKIHAERAVDADSNKPSFTAKNTNAASTVQKKKEDEGKKASNKEGAASKVIVTPSKNEAATTKKSTTSSKDDADSKYEAESKRKRTSRVIIRNLSFYATVNHVKSAMEINFGPVAAVDLPLVPDLPNKSNDDKNDDKKSKRVPRHRGFAFVTFTNPNAAKQAVEKGNEVKIKNRPVAIDFSVSKLEHKRMKAEETKEESDSGSESGGESEGDEEKDAEGSDSEGSSGSDSEEDGDSDSESEGESDSDDEKESNEVNKASKDEDDDTEEEKEAPQFDSSEASRTLFLRNIAFDATRHDVFELFRKYGRIEGVYLVKDRQTGVFKGTAFVRFEKEEGCEAAMEASGMGEQQNNEGQDGEGQFVSSKNIAMGLTQDGTQSSGLTLKGRHIFIDQAVDRSTASSLAVQRDEDGKPIKKMVGKDRRNLYLKNEGRVSSTADSSGAQEASAAHGGNWEELPPGDRSKRERAFAERSTKLRSPLFFINPTRISIRNLSKNVNEATLKKLVFDALTKGVEEGLATPKDAVSHWRAGGELPHSEVMRRATDPKLVVPAVDEKNMKGAIPSVFIERDVGAGGKSGDKKIAKDAPSRGFGFVEFTHHAHALAVLRQLNNNPMYAKEFVAGGEAATRQKRSGKKGKSSKGKGVDGESAADFVGEDGKVCLPRLIVEFTVENKVKARQQAEKIAQKKANKIKQRIENKDKDKTKKEEEKKNKKDDKNDRKKGRGALQREKKRARKEDGDKEEDGEGKDSKKQKTDAANKADADSKSKKETQPKMVKPQKKRKQVDQEENALEDMIRSYKSSFSQATGGKQQDTMAVDDSGVAAEAEAGSKKKKKKSRENVAKKRWFE